MSISANQIELSVCVCGCVIGNAVFLNEIVEKLQNAQSWQFAMRMTHIYFILILPVSLTL